MFTLLGWVLVGYFAGSLALWLFPPSKPVPGWQTVGFGVAGSVVGGMIAASMSGDPYAPAGFLISIVGAVVVVLGVRWFQEQG